MASSHDRMRWRQEGVTLEGCGSSWTQHQPLTICKDGLHSVAAQAQWLSGLKALTWDMEKTWGMETNTLHLYNGGPYMVMCIFPNHQTVYGDELCGGKAIPQDAHFGSH